MMVQYLCINKCIEFNTFECFFDGGDCCQTGHEPTCIKGVEYCVEAEIGDGYCQDYNKGTDDTLLNL